MPEPVSYNEGGSYLVMLKAKRIKSLVTFVAHSSKLYIFKGLTGANIPGTCPVKQKLIGSMKQYILYKNFD